MRNRAAAIADVQERSLRQRRQKFVRRMRREDRRTLMILRVTMHCMAFFIKRIEASVGVPRFIEVNAIDGGIEQLLNATSVVAQAVVRGVRNDGVDWTLTQ